MFIHLVAGMALAAGTPSGTFATHGDDRLKALIEDALGANPRVLRAFADYQAARHRGPQEAALPDPTVSFIQFARTVETRVGPQQRMLSVSQGIPGLGKRAVKSQLASKSAEVQDEVYSATKAEIVLRVKHAYYELGYLDRALAKTRADEGLLEHFEEIARRRYAQGFGLQADSLRLQAQIMRAVHRRQQLLGRRVDLEAALNSLRDVPADTEISEVFLPHVPDLDLERESLGAIGRQARSEVRAAFRRIEENEKLVHLARIRHRPDLTLGLAWGNIRARGAQTAGPPIPGDGKDSYAVSIGVTLPLFRRKYDAGIREAAERLHAARLAYRDSTSMMDAEIRSLSFRIENTESQIRLFETTLLPQAEQALESTLAAYATGAIEVTGLLDIQRTLLDVQLGLARLQADYLKAVADLERAIGAAVPEEVQS
ncbi:MAG: TolC family protein [Bryobacterales bacterium]|nr:TolC family protein [Bryobacterales bacterium]